MALHYTLENNELGLCLECGLLIEGAETGCVAYTTAALEELKTRGVNSDLLDLFFMGYQLQHFTYYEFNETRAISFLLTLKNYLEHRTIKNYANSKKKINAFLREHFFYLRQALTTVFITDLLNEADTRMCEAKIEQYIADILNAYFEYIEDLKELGSI